MKLTIPQQRALAAFLLSRFQCLVRSKGDAAEMTVIAGVFGVLALFGMGVPTSSTFLNDYWTTLGPIIYAPEADARDPSANLRVLMHEITHAVQFWRAPLDFVRRYVTATGRAELEAEAERGAIEGWYVLTGETPADLGAVDNTRHGYALDNGHADLTRDLLEQAVTSVRAGVVSTDVGLEVLWWMRANAPGMIAGVVHQ